MQSYRSKKVYMVYELDRKYCQFPGLCGKTFQMLSFHHSCANDITQAKQRTDKQGNRFQQKSFQSEAKYKSQGGICATKKNINNLEAKEPYVQRKQNNKDHTLHFGT